MRTAIPNIQLSAILILTNHKGLIVSDVYYWICIVILAIICVYLYKKPHIRKYDGDVVITREPGGKTLFSLALDEDPHTIHSKGRLVFRVIKEDAKTNSD